MNKTILSILMALLVLGLAQVAHAVTIDGCFEITDFEVDDDKVKPGDSFTVEIEVKNIATDDMDDDVEVLIEIEKMEGDGDDFEDDEEIDDLESGDKDNIDFDVAVPFSIKEGEYDIKIIVEGELKNGTDCRSVFYFNESIEVEKDKHELLMNQPVVSYETLKCSRTTEMMVTLYNIGSKDEDVELEVYNTELGINQKQMFELDEGDDEDDIKTTRTITLDLVDAKAKTYNFIVKAKYDGGNKYKSSSFNIKVEDCPTTTPDEPIVTPPEEEDVIISTPTPVVTLPTVTVPATVQEETFMEQYGVALLLGLAYIVVIVIGVLLVVSLLKKR
jgi:hypothetical protein